MACEAGLTLSDGPAVLRGALHVGRSCILQHCRTALIHLDARGGAFFNHEAEGGCPLRKGGGMGCESGVREVGARNREGRGVHTS